MRLLLDTHAFLWWLADDRRLRAKAKSAIRDSDNPTYVSAASIWEIAIKAALGRLDLGDSDIVAEIAANDFFDLPVSCLHARQAGGLPPHHADPFDRMLVAQAQLERLTLVTRDPVLKRYDVALLGI